MQDASLYVIHNVADSYVMVYQEDEMTSFTHLTKDPSKKINKLILEGMSIGEAYISIKYLGDSI